MYDLPWMHLRKYFLLQNHSFEKETMNPIYFSEIASRRAEAFGPAIGHDHVPTCHIFVLQGRIGTGAGEVFFEWIVKSMQYLFMSQILRQRRHIIG